MESDDTALVSLQDIKDHFPSIPPEASNITVFEPCNSVSNLATSRASLDLCASVEDWALDKETITALMQAYTILSLGSLFMHASGTTAGWRSDVIGMDLMAIVTHQGALKSLPYNPIVHDISEEPLLYSGEESAKRASLTILNDPVKDWNANFRALGTKS